jgi:hypothetical protein
MQSLTNAWTAPWCCNIEITAISDIKGAFYKTLFITYAECIHTNDGKWSSFIFQFRTLQRYLPRTVHERLFNTHLNFDTKLTSFVVMYTRKRSTVHNHRYLTMTAPISHVFG